MKHVTLNTVRKGNWLIKASCLDDQLLIFFYNECIMISGVAVFYCEEQAYNFIEGLDHESRSR
jgi:hypothetical protein